MSRCDPRVIFHLFLWELRSGLDSDRLRDNRGSESRYRAPTGVFSPPSSPSQSAYSMGSGPRKVPGSAYRCTSPEVGRLSFRAEPTTGDGNQRLSSLGW